MEFIQKMKKREFIEMGLKALAAVLAAFLAIILMESMIYGVELNALKTKGKGHSTDSGSSIAYCIEESEDKYFVIYRNPELNGKEGEWQATSRVYLTKEQCLNMEGVTVKEVVMHAPNAFVFSITPVHYVVMAVFVLGVAGFFVYKFMALSKEYKQIEETFNKTGTIEF